MERFGISVHGLDYYYKTIKGDEQTIVNVYNELNNSKHPVTIAMMKMDTVEEVRIIEGKSK